MTCNQWYPPPSRLLLALLGSYPIASHRTSEVGVEMRPFTPGIVFADTTQRNPVHNSSAKILRVRQHTPGPAETGTTRIWDVAITVELHSPMLPHYPGLESEDILVPRGGKPRGRNIRVLPNIRKGREIQEEYLIRFNSSPSKSIHSIVIFLLSSWRAKEFTVMKALH